MMNKIAESHLNALLAGSDDDVKTDLHNTSVAPSGSHDAIGTFLSTPSFSAKQIAIESLLKQITQGTPPGKNGIFS